MDGQTSLASRPVGLQSLHGNKDLSVLALFDHLGAVMLGYVAGALEACGTYFPVPDKLSHPAGCIHLESCSPVCGHWLCVCCTGGLKEVELRAL